MRHLTRRKFLEDSLFTATAALTAANLPAWAAASQQEARGRKVGANDLIRIAVIGVHGRGKDHVSGYAAMNDVAVAAICDVDSNVIGPALEIVEKRNKPRP